ncbi:DUF475 domain-containing protein [Massilia sp. W12]|uniref:DUF475 domain-containing protein n=1 Tax=Massilia sp. W12 TaxID=3126507 RepID=UPI0030CFAF22
MREFRSSFVVTGVAIVAAGFWGYSRGGIGGAASAVLLASILALMEISLSFDNAVVNAAVLQTWNAFWQKLFMTVGMLVAVFGMRLLFPLLIVSVVTGLGLLETFQLALQQPDTYSKHLSAHHAEVSAFGAAFLLLVTLQFLFDEEKEMHWFPWLETPLAQYGSVLLSWVVTLGAVWLASQLMPEAERGAVQLAGFFGVLSHVAVHGLSVLLEKNEAKAAGDAVKGGSIGGFMYLELLDASFSFDGVIGAFAITNDIIIIMLGLAVGAMFVRSMTIFLVHRGTLQQFVFLEHGAHYAIGVLALLMFVSVRYHVPEWITGLSGVAFIGLSLYSSVLYRRRHPQAEQEQLKH